MAGITNEGKELDKEIQSFFSGVQCLPKNSKEGDWKYKNCIFETKNALGGTANQIRPMNGVAIVGQTKNSFFFITPEEILFLSLEKKGQHCLDSTECMSLNKRVLQNYSCSKEELIEKVEQFCLDFEQQRKVSELCEKIRKIKENNIKEVKKLINNEL